MERSALKMCCLRVRFPKLHVDVYKLGSDGPVMKFSVMLLKLRQRCAAVSHGNKCNQHRRGRVQIISVLMAGRLRDIKLSRELALKKLRG